MLITNFAAGELSKTLFGRTDLPQYYRGAARMENFDVIPTGGLKRRAGMERLAPLGKGDGRIIPFIANRDMGFLLYLTPLEITVYKLVKGEIPTGEEPMVFASSYQGDEIGDVQYAQNFDTMVLCHENHPPLEVMLRENENVTIKNVEMNFDVEVVAGEGIASNEEVTLEDKAGNIKDEHYNRNGWLVTDANYPATVSFYNGRLIFACTKKARQRVFASAVREVNEVNEPYKFSTYKKFITPKREYNMLFGEINANDTSIVDVKENYIINSFSKPAEKYYVDSVLYDPDTRIEYVNLNRVKFTKGVRASVQTFSVRSIKEALQAKKDFYDSKNTNPETFTVYTRLRTVHHYTTDPENIFATRKSTGTILTATAVYCVVKASSIEVYYDKSTVYSGSAGVGSAVMNQGSWSKTFPKDASELIGNDSSPYTNEIMQVINNFIIFDFYSPPSHSGIDYESGEDSNVTNNDALKIESINRLYYNINYSMYYELETNQGIEKYYNYPLELMAAVMARIIHTNEAYIPIYTREIIADEYPTPDCGFTFEIASDANDAIRWLAVNKGLIVGTEAGEWVIPPDVHATNIQAKLNSRYGSDKIQGTAVGDAAIFFQTGKKSMVEYYIPQQDNNFRANNMAMLNPEILGESPALEFDYLTSPHAKLLITREDGAMAYLLYERSTGTFAWGRITTQGKIRSVAVLPGHDGNDDAYMIVERDGEYRLERLQEGCAVYLDSWAKLDKDAPWEAQREAYAGEGVKACRVYEEGGVAKYEALDADAAPDFTKDGDFYIGYSYKSVMRTMPVLANDKMKKGNIVNLIFRFLGSYMPKMTSFAGGRERSANGVYEQEPYTGIKRAPFPGTWDEEPQAQISADVPAPVAILAVNAEMQGGQ